MARGFSAMLRRLLLKNWKESATWSGIDVVHVAQVRHVRNPVGRAREQRWLGMSPWKQGAIASRPRLMEAGLPRRGRASG